MGQPRMGKSLLKETLSTSTSIDSRGKKEMSPVNLWLVQKKVLLLPLHTELGLMNNFIMAVDQDGSEFL
jgi:hypothetical protein